MYRSWLVFLFSLSISSIAFSDAPLETVAKVDLNRYLGVWYELASFPAPFQENCVAAQATYSLRKDGDIDVVNECHDTTPQGELRSAHARAWVVDKETNAKLKVRFFWPFSGNYWIIDLGKEYEFAVVSEPRRKYLWILSRTKTMPAEVYDAILSRLKTKGFDLTNLKKTPQS